VDNPELLAALDALTEARHRLRLAQRSAGPLTIHQRELEVLRAEMRFDDVNRAHTAALEEGLRHDT
jgi:hypothetical protein